MSEEWLTPDKGTYFDYETYDGYYRIEWSYWCETKQRRCWEPVSPDNVLAVFEAAKGIKQREKIGGYGHEGIPDLLQALAALES